MTTKFALMSYNGVMEKLIAKTRVMKWIVVYIIEPQHVISNNVAF